MALFHDDVFDAALSYISTNGVEAEVQEADDTVLVDSITLNSGNYGSPENNSGTGLGRRMQVFVNDADDMKTIAVTVAGTATKVAIKNAGGTVLTEVDLTAGVALTTADTVDLEPIYLILKDPA